MRNVWLWPALCHCLLPLHFYPFLYSQYRRYKLMRSNAMCDLEADFYAYARVRRRASFLLDALSRGDMDTVTYFANLGPDLPPAQVVGVRDARGQTPLHIIAAQVGWFTTCSYWLCMHTSTPIPAVASVESIQSESRVTTQKLISHKHKHKHSLISFHFIPFRSTAFLVLFLSPDSHDQEDARFNSLLAPLLATSGVEINHLNEDGLTAHAVAEATGNNQALHSIRAHPRYCTT